MRARLVPAIVLTCLVALAGAGAAGATASAAAIVPVEGPWSATTSAGLPVTFEVHGATVYNAHFGFKWGFCGSFESHNPNTDLIDAAGHWSYLDTRGQTIEATFVAADRVEGTVVAQERELPGCPATRAIFVAAPGAAPPPAPEPKAYVVKDLNTGHYAVEPGEIVIGRHRSFGFRELRWRDFGDSRPVAHGRAFIRRGGHVWRPGVTVRLRRLVERGPDVELYAKLIYELRDPVAPGFRHRGTRAML
jgi:hypothetical protein